MESYPLQWPVGRNRTPERERHIGLNKMHGNRIRQLLNSELRKMGVTNIIVSSNAAIRRDGQPYTNQRVDDPGVVLYFTRKGQDIAISCDAWHTVDANLRAIGLTVKAIRGMERWGTEEMIDRAFTGFAALPANVIVTPNITREWFEVLEVSPSAGADVIRAAYKAKLHIVHPDKGGSAAAFEELQRAYKEATS